ncbi:hypothetical protein ACI2KS_00910 [Pseudomonas sp. NPDC087358]|uniref:hypothetical protein n=1 Tax=Pseudomonas sp. NPDC087358 TaxID=3364439 RepID=UPI0038503B75
MHLIGNAFKPAAAKNSTQRKEKCMATGIRYGQEISIKALFYVAVPVWHVIFALKRSDHQIAGHARLIKTKKAHY